MGSWHYFCNVLRKKCGNSFVIYCDAKYFDILWGSSHVWMLLLVQNVSAKLQNGFPNNESSPWVIMVPHTFWWPSDIFLLFHTHYIMEDNFSYEIHRQNRRILFIRVYKVDTSCFFMMFIILPVKFFKKSSFTIPQYLLCLYEPVKVTYANW